MRFVEYLPLYGELFNSSRESIFSALKDLAVTTLFSLFPIWVYPIIVKLGFDKPFWQTAWSFVAGGEMFIYSAALVGPLIYAITKNYAQENFEDSERKKVAGVFPRLPSIQFPYGSSFVFLSMFICVFYAIFYGILKVKDIGSDSVQPNSSVLLIVSILLYLFTLSCFFCVSVYRLNLENPLPFFSKDTDELKNQWERTR
ncbi:MAG: hypothetical protein ISP41_17175 [Alphaproteobacteria bacterium]|nr:hypothetical protein [Alphaproteobacteria bacterium]